MEAALRKRQPAYKVLIGDLLSNRFVEQEGFLPNYVEIGHLEVSRANVIGVVVAVVEGALRSVIIDDGSGKISLRSMGENQHLSGLDVGQVVMIIGRIRQFADERYLTPEIVKQVHTDWLILRKKECEPHDKKPTGTPHSPPPEPSKNATENILAAIREHDVGEGVDIEKILDDVSVEGAEQLINLLIREGEIFELRPGIVKVLE